jgi:hypothetical protein
VPNIDYQYDARLIGFVVSFMVKGIIEHDALPFLQWYNMIGNRYRA